MTQMVWSKEELVRFTEAKDSEVRYWAVDRLIRHYPDECCEAIAELLFDEHDATPVAVARHLGEHGSARHHALLVRGFRLLRGPTPGHCLQALTRLGYPGAAGLAASAIKRDDLTEPALVTIVEALGELGSAEAVELLRSYVARKPALLAHPAAMRGALRVASTAGIPDLLAKFLAALDEGGSHRAGEAFRTLMDMLQIDDMSWCFRTGPSGHIELRKTIKAVESGYDCDISTVLGKPTINQIAQRFRAGNVGDIVRAIADWTCSAVERFPHAPDSDLPRRIAAAVGAFTRPEMQDGIEHLGHQFQQWLLGFQLSAAFAVARCQNFELALQEARGDLDRLLELAECETAFLLESLPAAVALACEKDAARQRKAQEWCLRMLEAKGPFFPKVVALQILGELRNVHFIPEIMDYLSDENSYVYGAAERALSKLGESVIGPALQRIETGSLNPDAAHSILVLLCDMGTPAAYEAVMEYLNWFMDAVGPGTTAEWVSLFGTEDLIDPLRDWLDQDPAAVGQGVLLLGAIHNVPIPEEDEILEAIEDARAREGQDPGDEGGAPGGPEQGGSYVM
jgi:hypothetical protein